jgi:serine/threonine protein phosphatase 1
VIFAVGDIHGERGQLEALLAQLNVGPDDTLLFLGDYIDRGDDSRGVLDVLIRLRQRYRTILLMGNHESMLLDWLGLDVPGAARGRAYLGNGGFRTLASYGVTDRPQELLERMPHAHLALLSSLSPWYLTESHVFVHGGIPAAALGPTPGAVADLLAQQDRVELLWTRMPVDVPHYLPRTIVYGHSPSEDGALRWNLPWSVGIDTGCGVGGRLSALRLPDGAVFQA